MQFDAERSSVASPITWNKIPCPLQYGCQALVLFGSTYLSANCSLCSRSSGFLLVPPT